MPRRFSLFFMSFVGIVAGCAEPGGQSFVLPTDTGDVAMPLDTAAPDDIDVDTSDVEVASCVEGLACDDRDPCTVDDVCRGGACAGVALSCDDGIPCTLDRCVSGACRHEVAPGFCRLEGACFTDQQRHPENFCLICDSEVSRGSWTSRDGMKCDDGDTCTGSDECRDGICQGLPVTTGVCTPEPEPEPSCVTHFDCYPDRVCVVTGEGQRCAAPCGSSADCEAGICRKVPGAANIAACVTPVGAMSGACVGDGDCASGICHASVCREVCVSESSCVAPGHTCRLIRGAQGACVPDGGDKALGQMCQNGGDIHSGACASQHCDLIPYGTSGSGALLPCAPLCQREQDCAAGQECGVVSYADQTQPGTVVFHPQYQTPTRAAVTACYSRQGAVQSLGSGTPCTSPTQCASNKCLRLAPDDPQRYCSGYCATDTDCPAHMQCKTDTITLASDWLQTPWITTQPATTQVQTLVRVCKFR